jgi:hypothetical protein
MTDNCKNIKDTNDRKSWSKPVLYNLNVRNTYTGGSPTQDDGTTFPGQPIS